MASGKRLDIERELALVEKCRRQNFDAFGEIVDAYQARVLGFVRGMVRSQEEALDVTQEVFIRAYQAFSKFDGRASLRTWLFKIAYNLCVDRSRRPDSKRDDMSLDVPSADGEAWEFADSRLNPEQVLINDELVGLVQRGMESMSEKLRSVLVLHDQEELSYEEIAAALEIPIGTVKSRLFLARNYLQNHLAEYVKENQR
jgi:RNA polymerase sigma-70 factor, ECF subfamily